MSLPIWIIGIAGGLAAYLFLLLQPKKEGAKMSHPAASLGAGSLAYSLLAFGWVVKATDAIPASWSLETLLVILTFISFVLTAYLSGLPLLAGAIRKGSQRISRERWETSTAVLGPALLTVCLLLFPLLRVSNGSLVAENGKILSFGSSYHFVPGVQTKLVGLNNPVTVSVRRHVKSRFYGEKDISFKAKVYLRLKPGDQLPPGFSWPYFEESVSAWFDQRLDDRYEVEPRDWASGDDMQRKLPSEHGAVMGVRIAWLGNYEIRP